jgi:hypothetical protein
MFSLVIKSFTYDLERRTSVLQGRCSLSMMKMKYQAALEEHPRISGCSEEDPTKRRNSNVSSSPQDTRHGMKKT